MIIIVLNIFGIALVIAAIYFLTVCLGVLLTGCTFQEAADKIHALINEETPYSPKENEFLKFELWNIIKDILGDARYTDLEKLSKNTSIFGMGEMGGVSYFGFLIPCSDDEKFQIETMLEEKLKTELKVHGCCDVILSQWVINPKLQLPILLLRYAETSKQEKLLHAYVESEQEKVIKKYEPLRDDDEEEDA
jgi:hypothetical protein